MFFKDILFPKFCLGCGFIGSYICLNCQKKLSYLKKDSCFYCKRASYAGFTHPACKKEFGIDGFIAVFHYSDLLKKIIKNIKYRMAKEILEELFQLMNYQTIEKLRFYKKLNNELFLQPIPLHPIRLRERGFNQSENIAEFLQKIFLLSEVNILVRTKNTFPQAQIKLGQKRYLNIKGAFKLSDEKLHPEKQILLVDDVVTTGSTVKEAARVLKKNGSEKVYVFALAKG